MSCLDHFISDYGILQLVDDMNFFVSCKTDPQLTQLFMDCKNNNQIPNKLLIDFAAPSLVFIVGGNVRKDRDYPYTNGDDIARDLQERS